MSVLLFVTVSQFIFKLLFFLLVVAAIVCPNKCYLLTYLLRTAGRGKLKFIGQEGGTDYSTAHAGSGPNYLRKASMEGNAVVRCEFGHVGN
jgi:hypothetical protein